MCGDSSHLYTGFSGFQFQGVPGDNHTVTVESKSMNGLTTVVTTGTISIRSDNAILITNVDGKLQIYIVG